MEDVGFVGGDGGCGRGVGESRVFVLGSGCRL